MKQLQDLHARMRAHHLKRAREETDANRRAYHLLLASSVRKPSEQVKHFRETDWRDARERWCARMRMSACSMHSRPVFYLDETPIYPEQI
jgi:hypothetical protein